MLPQFKPLLAIVILAAMAFGAEAGFLVGAAAMLVSDMLMGQGPWTPYQMVAAGLVGALAGLLCRLGVLPKRRIPMCIYGGLATVVIYGGILNPASLLLYQPNPTWPMILAAYAAGPSHGPGPCGLDRVFSGADWPPGAGEAGTH